MSISKKDYEQRYSDRSTSDSYYLICPYCAFSESNPYEISRVPEFEEEVTCQSCARPFLACRSLIVTYYGCPEIETE